MPVSDATLTREECANLATLQYTLFGQLRLYATFIREGYVDLDDDGMTGARFTSSRATTTPLSFSSSVPRAGGFVDAIETSVRVSSIGTIGR